MREGSDRGELGGVSRADRDNIRLVADLSKTAPAFDGDPAHYLLYKQALKGFLSRTPVPEVVMVGVAIATLKDDAKRFLGGLR